MKFAFLLKLAVLTSLASAAKPEAYPKPADVNQVTPKPYSRSDKITDLKCIQRQIDTGEHKFDAENNIVHADFPSCIETGEPLAFKFGVNDRFNCSFILTDEIYHLFQLYIHEDTPFSCKVHDYKDKTGGLIPITFSFRGNLESSHLDIDPRINIIGTYIKEKGRIGSLAAFSSGSTTSKYIIGDKITLQINNAWFDVEDGEFYAILNNKSIGLGSILFIGGVSSVISGTLLIWLLYNTLNKKALKLQTKDFGIEQSKFD